MEAIQIMNLRSLEDTGRIDIKPITVLVGRNSSGKSTFLRSFPLLKQSMIKKAQGPILWYGGPNGYVDFGSFQNALGKASEKMEFSFFVKSNNEEIKYSFVIAKHNEIEQVIEISMSIQGCDVSVNYMDDKLVSYTIHDDTYECPGDAWISPGNTKPSFDDGFVNIIASILSDKPSLPSFHYLTSWLMGSDYLKSNVMFGKGFFPATRQFVSTFDKLSQLGLNGSQIAECARVLGRYWAFDYKQTDWKEFFSSHAASSIHGYGGLFDRMVGDPEYTELLNCMALLYCSSMFSADAVYLSNLFENVCYIAPVRATAERYDRVSNESIAEIDSCGKNLVNYLGMMDEAESERFREWTNEHFHFEVFVEREAGNYSLSISENGSEPMNLIDAGFGYGQILPILTQLWVLVDSQRKNADIPIVFAIEQPELHLHPELQATLAKAFMAAVQRENGSNLRLVIETHSKTIVDRIGRGIQRNEIAKDDINVVLFEKEPGCPKSTVSVASFDKYGSLNNWPIGFFRVGRMTVRNMPRISNN